MNRLFVLLLTIWFCIPCFGQWTQLKDVPFINDHSNGFGFEGKGYIIQGVPGFSGGEERNQLWEYDPVADSWNTLGSVPAPPRELSIGDDMDGKYYFGFGLGRSDVWEYDPATNDFTELPACPCVGRGHPAFVAHNGKIYMGAGSSNNGDLKDWWVFDFATQQWSQKEDIPGVDRHHPYQFGIDDAIYVGGGHYGNWLRFDINTEEWTEISDTPAGRVAGTQFSFGGKGFVLTGDEADHSPLTEFQFLMYDPAVDEWYDLPFDFSMHRWAPSSFIIDTDLYFFGGFGANGGSDKDVWKFDLSTTTCVAPLNTYAINITENSAGLFWIESPTGNADTIQWREEGTDAWNTIVDPEASQIVEGLEACTFYEFRVNSKCEDASIFSDPFVFRTKGCGTCIDVDYCDVSDDFLAESCFINKVTINGFENASGNNNGYEAFTASSDVEVEVGGIIDLEVEAFFPFNGAKGNYKVWMDLNADGAFSEEEVMIDREQVEGNMNTSFGIPADATLGLTRLRIAVELNPIKGACEGSIFDDGEAEDYCITLIEANISDVDGIEKVEAISIHPNPSKGILWVNNTQNHSFEVNIYEVTGKLVWSGINPESIDLTKFHDGFYWVNVEDKVTQKSRTEKLILNK